MASTKVVDLPSPSNFTISFYQRRRITISLRIALALFTVILVLASAAPPSAILLVSSTNSLDIAKDNILDTLQYRKKTKLMF